MMMKMKPWLLALALLAVGFAGCGQAGQPAHFDGVTVTAPWAREIPPNAPVAGGFLSIHNGGATDDRLLAVRSEAAERVEIHEVRHEDGMARMRELADGLALPAGATVELKPGGYHLMFIAPGEDFTAGRRIPATLVFAVAGEMAVEFEVRAAAATGQPSPHAHH